MAGIAGVQWIDDKEMAEILDENARCLMGISGKQFIRNRNRGDYDKIDCCKKPEIVWLCFLAPERKRRK